VGIYRHLMGFEMKEAKEFFRSIFTELDFEVENSGSSMRAYREDVEVFVRLRSVEQSKMCWRNSESSESSKLQVPRTEVTIECSEEIHDEILKRIMRSRAGG